MSNDKRIEPIELSVENEQEAIQTFNEWLQKEEFALLIAFGEGQKVETAVEAANFLINEAGDYYQAVRVVRARKPKFIVGKLKKLEKDLPEIDWDDYENMALVAITVKLNIIVKIIKVEEVDENIKGRISTAVVVAYGRDREDI